jgi:mono/diheme cytochrome c family protein
MNKGLLATVALVVIGGAAVAYWKARTPQDDLRTPVVSTQMHGADAAARAKDADEIIVPQLSSAAQLGKVAFDESCAACHGTNASGTESGPPLIHKIYEPSHHSDYSFVAAVKTGTRAHHWRFGDMAPVEGVTDKQIEWITRYVREIQRANGIM